MFEQIVAATHRGDVADPTVASALKIAIHFRSRLHVVHVAAESGGRAGFDGKSPGSDDLRRVYAPMLAIYGRVVFHVASGCAWREIAHVARDAGAEPIVMGPYGSTRRAALAGGRGEIPTFSTVEGVLREQPRPVWIVNRQLPPRRVHLKSILVAVDFSESCRWALDYAVRLSEVTGGTLTVFHMHGIPPHKGYSQARYAADVARLKNRTADLCREVAAGRVSRQMVKGGVHPHLEVTAFAAKHDVDLIVMGSRTRHPEPKWYVGSAVKGASVRAHCPVAVVAEPQDRRGFGPKGDSIDSMV